MAINKVTVIKLRTKDCEFQNAVYHENTPGEFQMDITREVARYRVDNPGCLLIDVFWHLDEYCTQKYGDTHWQVITIGTLMENSNAVDPEAEFHTVKLA